MKLIGQTNGPAPDIVSFEGGINVLVAASDSGGEDVSTCGKRGQHPNDVTILLHVSADHTNAPVVSFPRDMIMPIASCPNPKGGNFPAQANTINVALTYGGHACIEETVENLTGLPIPFTAHTGFPGVVGLFNAVDRVTVCIAKAIHDEQISFDLARISNQQLFLSARVRKIETPETLGNPITDIGFDKVVFVQYPGSYNSAAGQNGVLPIRSAADILFTALKNDQLVSLTGKTGGGTTRDPTATVAPPLASRPHRAVDRSDGSPVDPHQGATGEGLSSTARRRPIRARGAVVAAASRTRPEHPPPPCAR